MTDVVVIGAGVGGLCAAAKLAVAGRRVLAVERDVRIGGRASTMEYEGFLLPQGGIALELGGPMEALFRSVGARYDVRTPDPGILIRVAKGRSINTTTPLARVLVDRIALGLGGVAVRRWERPADGPTLASALGRFPRQSVPFRLARNVAAGSFGVNADEVSAHAIATFLTTKGAFRRFGFAPRGTGAVLEELARVVERNGGEVRLETEVERITHDGSQASAVVLAGGEEVRCGAVVSNAGPGATLRMLGSDSLPAEYVRSVQERDVPTTLIVVDIASRHALLEEAGIVFFGTTDRLAAIGHVTASVPEVAPPGERLYTAYAAPIPALSPFDEEAEIAAVHAELDEQLTDLGSARILRTRVVTGDWPAMRTVAGREIAPVTPLANVVNCGDGVRDYGDGGMQSCAVTGAAAAEAVVRLGRSALSPA